MAGPRKRRRPSERLAEVRKPARGSHDVEFDVELRRVITIWKCPCSRKTQPKNTGGADSTGKPAPLKTNSVTERDQRPRALGPHSLQAPSVSPNRSIPQHRPTTPHNFRSPPEGGQTLRSSESGCRAPRSPSSWRGVPSPLSQSASPSRHMP